MLGLPFVNWNTQISNGSEEATTPDTTQQEDVARMRGTRPSLVLADYTGSYQNPAYGTFTLRLRNDTLLTAIGKQRVWLRHYHYDVFDLKGFEDDGRPDTADGGMKINFRIGVDGQVESAVIPMDPSLDPVEFKRQPLVPHLSEAQMQAYAGFYELAGMRVHITVKDGVIFMDVPGQTNYETIAQGNHYFKLKILNGFAIRFEMDETQSRALALYAIQPNGTFKATRVDLK